MKDEFPKFYIITVSMFMVFILLIILLSCADCFKKPQEVTVYWEHEYPPYADGFYLYAGFKSGKYVNYINLGAPQIDENPDDLPGKHMYETCVPINPKYKYFAMKAYNIHGMSDFSEEVSYSLTKPTTLLHFPPGKSESVNEH